MSVASLTRVPLTVTGDVEQRGSPDVSAAKLERQLKHVQKMLADKDAKVQKLTAQAKGAGKGGYGRDFGGRGYGGGRGGRPYDSDYGRSQYDDRDRDYSSQRRGK